MLAFARPVLDWVALDLNDARNPTGKRLHPFDEQLQAAMPWIYEKPDDLTCAQCVNRVMKKRGLEEQTYCELRLFFIKDADPACEVFNLRYD